MPGCHVTINDGGVLKIGKNVFFNRNCSINAKSKIVISDDTLFGESVKLYDHNHNFSDPNVPVSKQGFKCRDITIGKNCWIGSNCVILSGSVIEQHCVIGAGCIINMEIKENSLVKCGRDIKIEKIR